ncbi:MAG: c-type cytochrome [Acidobacteriota bacterium]
MWSRNLPLLLAVCCLAVAILLLPGLPIIAQQRPELPDAVQEWLALDQAQRWARQLETGERLFNDGICAQCHGQAGSEGRYGPDLADDEWLHSDGSLLGIRETIRWGVRKQDLSDPDRPFMLPSGGMQLSGEELAAVTAYVWSLSNGTFLRQR